MTTLTMPPVASTAPADQPVRRPAGATAVAPSPLSAAARWGSLAVVLAGTAILYLVGLDKSGYANQFYSAAAQAGSKNWEAWFFGSLDAANSITVDKPPAAMWVMGLSVRLFGLSSWSILVPEAIMGVLTAWLLYATVRRVLLDRDHGSPRVAHWAGIVGAAAMALTPAAALMFRFNNPDALLALLVTASVYCVVRGLERGKTVWVVLAGTAIGFGFLTKMLQAFLILPVLALVWVLFAPTSWKKRLLQLLYAALAVVVSAGWYVAIFELTPADKRPYMGGSQTNSMLELVFGYNGLGRIDGQETGSVTGGGRMGGAGGMGQAAGGAAQGGFGGQGFPGGAGAPGGMGGQGGGMWGQTGILRMFSGASGQMVSFLLPAALILTVVGLVVLGRRARTNLVRAGLVLAAGWTVVTALVFSFMAGIYHDYYTVALAPAIAATVAIGAALLWQARRGVVARIGFAVALLATAAWSATLVQQAKGIYVTIGDAAAVVLALAAVGLLFAHRLGRILSTALLSVAAVAALAAPASYAVQTASVGHQGSIVTAGPVQAGFGGRGGMHGGARGQGGFGGQTGQNGQPGFPGGFGQGGNGQPPAGGQGGTTGTGTTGTGRHSRGSFGTGQTGSNGATGGMGGATGGMGGGMGGMLDGMTVSDQLKSALQADAGHYTWVAATVGSQTSASLQLATGDPVMAIGGFNGSDPSPTLQQFQSDVAAGKIHYFVAGGGMGGHQNGGSDAASQITSWVESHYKTTTIGGTTVYDLTQPTGN